MQLAQTCAHGIRRRVHGRPVVPQVVRNLVGISSSEACHSNRQAGRSFLSSSSLPSPNQSRRRGPVAPGKWSAEPRPHQISVPAVSRPTWGTPGHDDHDGKGPVDNMFNRFTGRLKSASVPYVTEAEVDGTAADDVLAHGPLARMRRACRLAATILAKTQTLAETPGTKTQEIDALVRQLCSEAGAYPSPLNYRGFPKSVCTSVNEVLAHGIPDDHPLQHGDIVNVDVSIFLDGFHGDTSRTFIVGDCDQGSRDLVQAARDTLTHAIQHAVAPGRLFSSIGETIEAYVKPLGFTVSRDLAGHGIGEHFHMPPMILHVANDLTAEPMQIGHVFTIEPILIDGPEEITIWDDEWTIVSSHGGRSAQFEHTVLVTRTGYEILTIPEA